MSVPFLAFAKVGPFPLQVVVFFLMAVLVGIFLAHTRLGRSIYAVGGNPAAAAVAGVNVRRVQVATYALCGLLAARRLGAVLRARVGSGTLHFLGHRVSGHRDDRDGRDEYLRRVPAKSSER